MKRVVLIFAAFAAACNRSPQELAKRHLESADKYASKGQLREAEILYRRAIKSDPRLAVAYGKLTDVYLRGKKVGESINPLRRAIELLPEGPERMHRRIQLADCLLFYLEQAFQNAAIIEEVERLAGDLGETYDGWRVRGRLYTIQARALAERGGIIASSKEMREAIIVLEKAERVRPATEDVTIPLARSLWLENEQTRAIEILRRLTAKHPESIVGWSDLIRFLEMDRKLDEADAALRSAIRANPKHYNFYLRLATHWRYRGDRPKMEQAISQLRATASENPVAHEMIASFYRDATEWDKAIAEYEAAKQKYPARSTPLELMIADVYMVSQRRDQARNRITALLQANPKNPEVRARYAALLFEDGKASEAMRELEAIVQQIPLDFGAHYNLGRARRRVGQLELARLALQDAVRLNPAFVPGQTELMSVLVEMEQWGNALLTAEKLLSSARDVKAGLVRAAALRHIGKHDEARAQLQSLKEWGAPEGVRLLELGKLELAAGRRDEALAAFRSAYAAGSVDALIEAAQIQGSAGKSFALIEAECKKNPNNAGLQLACADFAVVAGRLGEAAPVYEKALERARDDAERVSLLLRSGETLRRARQIDAALARFERAAKMQPDNATVNHQLAIVLDQLGRRKEAMAAYDRTLKGNPDNSIALNNLAWHIYETGGDLNVAQTYAQRARQLAPNQLEYADTLGLIYLRKNLRDNAKAIFRDLVQKSPGNAAFREHLRQAESGG